MKKAAIFLTIATFFLTCLGPIHFAGAQPLLGLPEPGARVAMSDAYKPVLLKGITVHKNNPFLFDFVVDAGDAELSTQELKASTETLVKYFLAALAIPQKDLWVNLSPYEPERIVPTTLGLTDMGRDMLAQDYLLKQLTASLMYPEGETGRQFWAKIYTKAQERFGRNVSIPTNTFNKVWIMADQVEVFERQPSAYVAKAHLKVMLEEDYLALDQNKQRVAPSKDDALKNVFRDVVLPEIEHEVNQGKNFAPLRQIFHSLILAQWYKNNLKNALINQRYTGKSRIKGIDLKDRIDGPIYERYLTAYKKGVFNFIKTDAGRGGQPKKYFAGGIDTHINMAMIGGMDFAQWRGRHVYSVRSVFHADKSMNADGPPGDKRIYSETVGRLTRLGFLKDGDHYIERLLKDEQSMKGMPSLGDYGDIQGWVWNLRGEEKELQATIGQFLLTVLDLGIAIFPEGNVQLTFKLPEAEVEKLTKTLHGMDELEPTDPRREQILEKALAEIEVLQEKKRELKKALEYLQIDIKHAGIRERDLDMRTHYRLRQLAVGAVVAAVATVLASGLWYYRHLPSMEQNFVNNLHQYAAAKEIFDVPGNDLKILTYVFEYAFSPLSPEEKSNLADLIEKHRWRYGSDYLSTFISFIGDAFHTAEGGLQPYRNDTQMQLWMLERLVELGKTGDQQERRRIVRALVDAWKRDQRKQSVFDPQKPYLPDEPVDPVVATAMVDAIKDLDPKIAESLTDQAMATPLEDVGLAIARSYNDRNRKGITINLSPDVQMSDWQGRLTRWIAGFRDAYHAQFEIEVEVYPEKHSLTLSFNRGSPYEREKFGIFANWFGELLSWYSLMPWSQLRAHRADFRFSRPVEQIKVSFSKPSYLSASSKPSREFFTAMVAGIETKVYQSDIRLDVVDQSTDTEFVIVVETPSQKEFMLPMQELDKLYELIEDGVTVPSVLPVHFARSSTANAHRTVISMKDWRKPSRAMIAQTRIMPSQRQGGIDFVTTPENIVVNRSDTLAPAEPIDPAVWQRLESGDIQSLVPEIISVRPIAAASLP